MPKYMITWTELHQATIDAEDELDALDAAEADSDWWEDTWVKGCKKDMRVDLYEEDPTVEEARKNSGDVMPLVEPQGEEG